MHQTVLCLFGFQVIGTEEPYEGNFHVRDCGGSGRVIGCFYTEVDQNSRLRFRIQNARFELFLFKIVQCIEGFGN